MKTLTSMIALVSLKHEASINQVSGTQGTTALMMAVQNGHAETVKYLLKEGADTTIQSVQGWTALQYAEAQNNPEIVAILNGNEADE